MLELLLYTHSCLLSGIYYRRGGYILYIYMLYARTAKILWV